MRYTVEIYDMSNPDNDPDLPLAIYDNQEKIFRLDLSRPSRLFSQQLIMRSCVKRMNSELLQYEAMISSFINE